MYRFRIRLTATNEEIYIETDDIAEYMSIHFADYEYELIDCEEI